MELQKLAKDDLHSRSMSGTYNLIPNTLPNDPKLFLIVYGDFASPLLQGVSDKTHEDKPQDSQSVSPLFSALQGTGRFKQEDKQFELQVGPIKGEQNMFRLKPAAILSSGLYEFSVVGCPDNGLDGRCYLPFRIP